tara:strand:+ start:307 stop:705 length:399 start_codon:yes stop_codon:yes gene_type:complete
MKETNLKSFIKEEIISILSEATEEEVKNQEDLNKELEKTLKHEKELAKEDIDVDDDKDAVKAAKAARGKFKKLDLAVKSLRDIKKEMISYAKEYGKSDDENRKEEIKNILREKTPIKKELESLVAKLEKNAV